jgi:hypothetical protein
MVSRYTSLLLGLFLATTLPGQVARRLHLEYKGDSHGVWTAFLTNEHDAEATAYIAQATFRYRGKQTPTAFGGDTMQFPEGGVAIPPRATIDSGRSLPAGSEPLTTGIIAVIYADGFTEGDQAAVQMLLSGRHRSLLDLPDANGWLHEAVEGRADRTTVFQHFQQMRDSDRAEAASLDSLIEVPSLKHVYFMGAVPNHALSTLGNVPPGTAFRRAAGMLLAQYETWLKTLRESKPQL